MSSNGTENGHHPDLRHRSVPPGNDAVVRVGVNVVCPAGRFTLIPAQNTNSRQGENGTEENLDRAGATDNQLPVSKLATSHLAVE